MEYVVSAIQQSSDNASHRGVEVFEKMGSTPEDGGKDVVLHMLSILDVSRYEDYHAAVASLFTPIEAGNYESNKISDLIENGEVVGSTYSCPDGGSIDYLGAIAFGAEGATYRLITQACEVNELTINGTLSATSGSRRSDGNEYLEIVFFRASSIIDSSRQETLNMIGPLSTRRFVEPRRYNGYYLHILNEITIEPVDGPVTSIEDFTASVDTPLPDISDETFSTSFTVRGFQSGDFIVDKLEGALSISDNDGTFAIESNINITYPEGLLFPEPLPRDLGHFVRRMGELSGLIA
ncbi:MAG: hypothetical protein V3U76_18505 [Granulosicoccus sp.]